MSTRKIKNAVNNTTGELIYFKGHAQATYMSDGSTVEDTIKNIKPDLSDYVKSEELEGYAKTSDIPSLEGYAKEEDIPSLDGYVQSSELPDFNEFAKESDVYVWNGWDGESTEGTVTEEEFNAIKNAKIVVAGGIVCLSKIDWSDTDLNIIELLGSYSLQETTFNIIIVIHNNSYNFEVQYEEKIIPTLTSQLENDSDFISSNELDSKLDQKGYATKSELNDKQDTLISGTNIKTINGESIIGEGNIVVEGNGENFYEVVKVSLLDVNENHTQARISEEDLQKILNRDVTIPILIDGDICNISFIKFDDYLFEFESSHPLISSRPDINFDDLGFNAGGASLIRYHYTINTQNYSVSMKPIVDMFPTIVEGHIAPDLIPVEQLGLVVNDAFPNGVYAVSNSGNLILDSSEINSDCIGVAVIYNGSKFFISKNQSQDFYYWNGNNQDAVGINNYNHDGGYSNSFKDGDVISDFSGKQNTDALQEINANSTYQSIYTSCSEFNNSPELNSGYDDWYIPSMGQLVIIYNNLSEINRIIGLIGDDYKLKTSYVYWSSSEASGSNAWGIYFGSGYLYNTAKNQENRVLLIRDFEVKTIKERISEIESKITQLNAVLVDTEEEADDPIVSEYVSLDVLETRLSEEIPTKTSQLTNDSGFLT